MRKLNNKNAELEIQEIDQSENLRTTKTVPIKEELHTTLKILATKRKMNLQDFVNNVLTQYLEAEAESVKS